MVKYDCNAWGKPINGTNYNGIILDTTNNNIGSINPFRYKGYYYDDETQLFKVSSRYYSPELCRWISPDSIEYLDPQSINGLNLYCYCKNNPVLGYDPNCNYMILLFWNMKYISKIIEDVKNFNLLNKDANVVFEFYQKLEYKLKLRGISLIYQNVAYTSSCPIDSKDISKEYQEKHRIKRGLYKHNGIIYNADCIGAYNIMR